MKYEHKTVLIEETLSALEIDPNGIYVDCTAGGGGLSYEIASRLSDKGRLICIDQDPDAIEVCKNRLKEFQNVNIIKDNFANIRDIVHNLEVNLVNGIVLDLGISSYQLDSAERGFSYRYDAPLDMRMSKEGKSAYDVVNFFSSSAISEIIYKYGEERFSNRIANLVVERRAKKPIKTTLELVKIITDAIPCAARRHGGHPARKTFQAIRIYVNNELENLSCCLDQCLKLLKLGANLIVITFHSLEDRIVKQKMREWGKSCICPSEFPICVCGKLPKIKIINRKPIVASTEEVDKNFRSRSAKMRVCKKVL